MESRKKEKEEGKLARGTAHLGVCFRFQSASGQALQDRRKENVGKVIHRLSAKLTMTAI